MGNPYQLKIWYSVESCGDGSAYPVFFESEELAEWHQEHLVEGWGESCCGSIKILSSVKNSMRCYAMQSALQFYLRKEETLSGDWDKDDFLAIFFPDGLPTLEVEVHDANYYSIFQGRNPSIEYKYFDKPISKKGALELQNKLNS